jgi:hypothetical protein
MEIAFFTQHMTVMNGYKEEEYPNCKFPTFNSGKTIERQVKSDLATWRHVYSTPSNKFVPDAWYNHLETDSEIFLLDIKTDLED